MKKLYMGLLAGAFVLTGFAANAETVKGQVISEDDGIVTVESGDKQMKMRTTDNTKYRKRKMMNKDKMKNGRHYKKGEPCYKSMIDDKDWVDIIYVIDPQTKEMLIEEVIITED